MKGKVIYTVVGVLLILCCIVTDKKEISKRNQKIYDSAVDMERKMSEHTVDGFQFTDYKVRMFDGENDYVLTKNGVKREEPVFATFVGTSYPVGDHYEVLVPTVERLGKLISILNASHSGELTGLFQDSIANDDMVCMLYHEAWHCYQMTNYMDAIEQMVRVDDMISYIMNEIDTNPKLRKLTEQEMKVLLKAVEENNASEQKKYVLQYIEIQKEREQYLDKNGMAVEQYFELVEGSAQYVQGVCYEELYGTDACRKELYEKPCEYTNGSQKYYTIGMLKCKLLVEQDPQFLTKLDYRTSYDTWIKEIFTD